MVISPFQEGKKTKGLETYLMSGKGRVSGEKKD